MSVHLKRLSERLLRSSDPAESRHAILNEVFNINLRDAEFNILSEGIKVYFDDWWDIQFQQCERQVSARTYDELVKIIAYLRNPAATVRSIRDAVRTAAGNEPDNADDTMIDASTILAARLFLMLSIGNINLTLPPGKLVTWGDGSIQEAITEEFALDSGYCQPERIPKVFTAANLEIIAGIKVCWTSNLADHLLMKEDESAVMLFHHVSFLKLHQASNINVLPRALIDETLSTLSLLLPARDKRTQRWFRRKTQKYGLDPLAGACERLPPRFRRIEKFQYWRERLIIVKQAFDDSEPDTVGQWWFDDRRKVQWYTFWVAALVFLFTILFGVLQVAAGVVQAWAAIKALNQGAGGGSSP